MLDVCLIVNEIYNSTSSISFSIRIPALANFAEIDVEICSSLLQQLYELSWLALSKCSVQAFTLTRRREQ